MLKNFRTCETSLLSIDKLEECREQNKRIVFADSELGYLEVPTEINAEYIQVAVASTVTARARLELLKALKYCDKRGEVYYCDTDSIVTDVELPADMVDPVELGKWDLESEPVKALFLKPKVYAEVLEDKTNVKFKGVSHETQSKFDFDSYENLLHELESGEKEFVIVEKNKSTFRSIMYMKKKGLEDDYYETRDKKMNLKTVEKRQMYYEENKTAPYYFESLDEFNNFSFSNYKEKVFFDMT